MSTLVTGSTIPLKTVRFEPPVANVAVSLATDPVAIPSEAGERSVQNRMADHDSETIEARFPLAPND